MKLIIAGGRDITPEAALREIILLEIIDFTNMPALIGQDIEYLITELITGTATGVDQVSYLLKDRYEHIILKEFPADWSAHGKAAGPIRNAQMAEYADVLVLVWDGESRGSASMKREMIKRDKPVYEVIVR